MAMVALALRGAGRALGAGRAPLLRQWARAAATTTPATAAAAAQGHEGRRQRRWRAWDRRWALAAAAAAAFAVSEAVEASEGEKERESGGAPAAAEEEKSEGLWEWAQRKYERAKFVVRNPVVSARPFVLPPAPEPHYTLVLDVRDLLFEEEQPDGTKRPRKRPGVDRFLAHLAQFFELVLWCSGADPMQDSDRAARLDRRMCCSAYIFYNECTMTEEGLIVKDLARLNREMANVVLLASDPQFATFQPENALILPPWDGARDDTTLLDLCYFFEDIASRNPEQTDVRQVLKSYEGKDLLSIWRPIREQHEATLEESQQQLQKMREGGSLLAKLRKI